MKCKKPMHLLVKVKSHCLPVDVPPAETVYGLKHKIHEKIQISPQYQKIAFKGNFLGDSSKLKICGVKDGSRVHLAVTKVAFAPESQLLNQLAPDVPPKIRSSSCNCIASRAINLDVIEVSHLGYYHNLNNNVVVEANPSEGRNLDTYLDHIELKPKGFIKQTLNMNAFASFIESQKKARSCCRVLTTVIPEPPKSPSIDPLPTPFIFFIDPINIHKNGSDQPAQ